MRFRRKWRSLANLIEAFIQLFKSFRSTAASPCRGEILWREKKKRKKGKKERERELALNTSITRAIPTLDSKRIQRDEYNGQWQAEITLRKRHLLWDGRSCSFYLPTLCLPSLVRSHVRTEGETRARRSRDTNSQGSWNFHYRSISSLLVDLQIVVLKSNRVECSSNVMERTEGERRGGENVSAINFLFLCYPKRFTYSWKNFPRFPWLFEYYTYEKQFRLKIIFEISNWERIVIDRVFKIFK